MTPLKVCLIFLFVCFGYRLLVFFHITESLYILISPPPNYLANRSESKPTGQEHIIRDGVRIWTQNSLA